jgi:hypothetical protein
VGVTPAVDVFLITTSIILFGVNKEERNDKSKSKGIDDVSIESCIIPFKFRLIS